MEPPALSLAKSDSVETKQILIETASFRHIRMEESTEVQPAAAVMVPRQSQLSVERDYQGRGERCVVQQDIDAASFLLVRCGVDVLPSKRGSSANAKNGLPLWTVQVTPRGATWEQGSLITLIAKRNDVKKRPTSQLCCMKVYHVEFADALDIVDRLEEVAKAAEEMEAVDDEAQAWLRAHCFGLAPSAELKAWPPNVSPPYDPGRGPRR